VAGWVAGCRAKIMPPLRPILRSLWDRIGLSSGPSVAIIITTFVSYLNSPRNMCVDSSRQQQKKTTSKNIKNKRRHKKNGRRPPKKMEDDLKRNDGRQKNIF
jgi:hypothetical protein